MFVLLVATIVALANLAALWDVNQAIRQPSAAEFARYSRRLARLCWLCVGSSIAGFAINLLLSLARSHTARAQPGPFIVSSVVHALAFAVIGALYPGGAAVWLARQARRRG